MRAGSQTTQVSGIPMLSHSLQTFWLLLLPELHQCHNQCHTFITGARSLEWVIPAVTNSSTLCTPAHHSMASNQTTSPLMESKVKHLPGRVKQQCNPFHLCYVHSHTSSAICRHISVLFLYCLKLQNKKRIVRLSLFLDISCAKERTFKGQVVALEQQFSMTETLMSKGLSSKYLVGISVIPERW